MATFHASQAGPELAAACGTQANPSTYSRETSPGDRKWASRTRKNLRPSKGVILLARPL